ncbi:MAG: TolC family protein [Polyangiaceae bacterium]
MRAFCSRTLGCSILVAGLCGSAGAAADEGAPRVEVPSAPEPLLEPPAPAAKSVATGREAVHKLFARSTDLRIVHDDLKRAEARWRGALAQVLPQVSATGTDTFNVILWRDRAKLSDERNYLTGEVAASMPVVDVRAWYAVGTAERAITASALTVTEQRRVLLVGFVSALVAIYTTERVAEIGRTSLQDAIDRRDLAKKRQALGAGTELDVLRTEQDVVNAKATVVANNESVRRARDGLGLALGDSEPWSVLPSFTLDDALAFAKNQCHPVSKLEDRADFASAQTRIEVAERTRRQAAQAFLPTLSVRSSFGGSTNDRALSPSWNMQGLVTFSIWDGGSRYADLKDTAAQSDQAAQRYEALRRRESIELLETKRAIQVATDARKLAVDGNEAAIRSDHLIREAFANGRGTSLELVTAATARRQAEINLALREFELVRAQALATLALSRCEP